MVAHFGGEVVLPLGPLVGGLHKGSCAFAEASLGSSPLHEDQDLEHIVFRCKQDRLGLRHMVVVLKLRVESLGLEYLGW